MSCYHPLKAFPIGLTTSGKTDYKICSYEVDHVELQGDHWVPSLYIDRGSLAKRVVREFEEIPCGHCIGCRLQYSRDWANRCMLELEYHESAYFATLTYNDEHVPRSWYCDPDTGEAYEALTLKKRDLQLFMKRLRKRHGLEKIRFFAAGEYGSHTFRPHYHLILFGVHFGDLEPVCGSLKGCQVYQGNKFQYYTSADLQSAWSTPESKGSSAPLGFVLLAPVSWATCAYTARYVMKKATGATADFYEAHNIEPEFSLMSRKPGIGRQWYDDHPDMDPNEYINISTEEGGRKFLPPKYYRRLFEVDQPERSAELKEIRRRMAEDARKIKLSKTSLSYLEMLGVEERAKKAQIKSLRRDLI